MQLLCSFRIVLSAETEAQRERVDTKFFSATETTDESNGACTTTRASGDSRQAVPFLADDGRLEEVLEGQQVEDAKEELFRQVVP